MNRSTFDIPDPEVDLSVHVLIRRMKWFTCKIKAEKLLE